ncbi:cysteine hydrolase family protein [Murdochiella massiliensis]|uniref:cysteine hydrolase family protein n=1 Tax=Murdochiella massiliensis TaxID=1673723 RepID=UPI000829B094|nr:cysteine hydrolase [Murdochiella massiliensis]
MQNILLVVDMQNDFIDGALGSQAAQAVVPYVVDQVKNFEGTVLFTRDTHRENYANTQEGRNLPVMHCLRGTHGWQLHPNLEALRKTEPIDKVTFGAASLPAILSDLDDHDRISSITLLGLDTDICVISNALLIKAFFPEIPIKVDAQGCAGVTPESHQTALKAMKACQIEILNV